MVHENRGHVVDNQIENNNVLNCKEGIHVVYVMLQRLGFNPEHPFTVCVTFRIFSVYPCGFPFGSLVLLHVPGLCPVFLD